MVKIVPKPMTDQEIASQIIDLWQYTTRKQSQYLIQQGLTLWETNQSPSDLGNEMPSTRKE